ncbi:amidohydrolase family protein [Luminiphilus sp.]|nr:amidohydrolase family protein [Luminiphilus sp.]
MMAVTRTALLFVLALLLSCGDSASRSVDIAIEHVTLVDAINPIRENQTLLIDDGRIVAIGSSDTLERVSAQTTVDGSGQFLIPGLWDFHVHFTFDKRFTDAMAGLFLYHGVTNVRDTGGLLKDILPVVETLRASGDNAPSIWYSGPLLDGADVVYDGVNFPGLGIANPTPEAARANIAEIHAAGASFLKIYEMVSPEVFAAIVDEARLRNLPIDGHVPLSMRARDVAPQVQSLEHLRNYEMDCVSEPEIWLAARQQQLANTANEPGNVLRTRLHELQRLTAISNEDPEVCAEMTEALKATITVPTLRMNSMDLHIPFMRGDFDQAMGLIPASVQQEWEAARTALLASKEPVDTTFAEWSLRRTGELHAAGVPIAAGTDTPIGWSIPGYSLHTELEQYVEVGMTPLEALHSATVAPAEYFGLEDEMGQLQVGFIADAVLLTGNPLENIIDTRRVQAVINRGTLLTRAQLDSLITEH